MPAATRFEHLKPKLAKLPASPGCYIFRDADGKPLYVGKALSLRSRVRSYFQSSTRHGNRIARMVAKVRDVEWIVVDSEVEALVLECNLIKRHRPPYNVLLRDDKSYPYVVITNERFPRVLFTRNVRRDGAKYFGPYTSAYSVRETLQLLHKVFTLIPCGKSWTGEAVQRPCLYFHLGQCLAPCAGLSNPNDYKSVIREVSQFLSGRGESLISNLKSQMDRASEATDFEKAAAIRDKISALESMLQKQKVLDPDKVDKDVIAVVKGERGAAIQMLYIRGGKLIGQRQFLLDRSVDAAPTEAVQEFVKQYYADAPEVPREVLLPVEIEERSVVEKWLRQRRGAAVAVEVPKGGDGLALVEMAATNAEQALHALSQELLQKEAWAEQALAQLQEAFGLPAPPLRIEGFDISNVQGTAPVGSMVVFEDGAPAKGEYRRFKVRWQPETPNDFSMMKEVVTRRFRAYLDGQEKFSKLPDLMLIDGGKGQLSAALEARDELRLTTPIVGLAKKMELLYVPKDSPSPSLQRQAASQGESPSPYMQGEGAGEEQSPSPCLQGEGAGEEQSPSPCLQGEGAGGGGSGAGRRAYDELELPLTSPGLILLRRLRDEAHRFALTFHRKVRDKRLAGSVIEEIPGIGPRRKRLLLRTFGSLEGIRRATVDEIASVPTMTKRLAEQVKEFLAEA